MSDLIERYKNLVKSGFEYAVADKGIAPTSTFEIYMGHFYDVGRDLEEEISRLRQLLSEAEKREMEARTGWAFAEGDMVRKKSGSWWEGRVVGTYSTAQTPRGYAVQLDKPFGPVQIYPESALELFFLPMSEAELVDALNALQSEER